MQNRIIPNQTVVAIGKFDGVHIGHRRLISEAVSIAKQNNIRSLVYFICPTGGFGIFPYDESEHIAKMLGADLCIRRELDSAFKSLSPEDFVERVLIGELGCIHAVVGYDFKFGRDRTGDVHMLKSLCHRHSIECSVIGEVTSTDADGSVHTVKSTKIRALISEGRMDEISSYLGQNYYIRGIVEYGRQIGRQIGLPTANIKPESGAVIPPDGVYAAKVHLGEEEYVAVTNIGSNPTVADTDRITVESHIMNFDRDIYGKEIKVEFIKRIRPEVKFDSLDALRRQIIADMNSVKEIVE